MKFSERNPAALRSQLQGWKDRAANYEDEIDRLKVCGTCGSSYEATIAHEDGRDAGLCCIHRSNTSECQHPLAQFADEMVHPADPCHFTPPRWTPYWEDE